MILRSERVLSSIGVPHAFTLRDPFQPGFGNISFKFGDPQDVLAARAEALRDMGQEPADLVLASQCHGTRIHRVTEEYRGRGALNDESKLPDADGLVTDLHGLPIGVQVADCCCLLIADRSGSAVGAFHAGWRGTFDGMAREAVLSFNKEFGIPASDLSVWIGPAISGKNYEVDEALWGRFKAQWGEDCLLTNPWRIDLPRLNIGQLLDTGTPMDHIEDCGICTFESEWCFSHRRGDSPPGRMMGVVARLPPQK
jgi:hypothetical protein